MNLQEYRKLKYISVKQASEELGISLQHIYDIEKGKSFPSRKLCIKIYEWSDGLVNIGELLFPDLAISANNNPVKLENWEENGRRNKKYKFYDLRNIRNGRYIEIRHDDEEWGDKLIFLIFDETIKSF